MADLIVNGGKPLNGEVTASGYKNSIVSVIPASLLTDETVVITNVPDISDVRLFVNFLRSIGSKIKWSKRNGELRINNSEIDPKADLSLFPHQAGGAVMFFPGLLYRMGEIDLKKQLKGCALGIRELDPIYEILEVLGAQIIDPRMIHLKLDGGFKKGTIWAEYQKVVGTEVFAIAAAMGNGESVLINAAAEPQVEDTCLFLKSIGADIEGIGSNKLIVRGKKEFGGSEFRVKDDYYEVATFLALGAMTGGQVKINYQNMEDFGLIAKTFEKLGVKLEIEDGSIKNIPGKKLKVEEPLTTNFIPKIESAPWPYFPVDLMPIFMALATKAEGKLVFWDKVYYGGGFVWFPELMKFGIEVFVGDPNRLVIFGNKELYPAVVNAPYIIRVAIAFFMIAASIEGRSIIKDADPIKRAHPDFVQNLNRLGVDVSWV